MFSKKLFVLFCCVLVNSFTTNVYEAPLYDDKSLSDVIPNEYIVIYKKDTSEDYHDLTLDILKKCDNYEVIHFYPNGFAAYLDELSLETVRSFPEVEFVEPNSYVSIHRNTASQENPPSWGLPRTNQREFESKEEYIFPAGSGSGVDVYVVDTGVFIEHKDFEGRASWGFSTIAAPDVDGNGHGTHVATTIAGKKYGIAKKAHIIAVRVLNASGSGTMADVVAGVNFVTANAKKTKKKSVANMSLGGGFSLALNAAVAVAIESGVSFAVAAGNSNADACRYSPASVPTAISTGASDVADNVAQFSNYGKCVTLFAPGVAITGGWIGSPENFRTISGTSMASPHVAGVAALLLSEEDYTPAELKKKLVEVSTKNKLNRLKPNSPNFLLYNDIDGDIGQKDLFY
jgi:cerevisin